ncbi:hypothetical protein BMS_1969 [Halobacteriovorax marinus SJ]|uniref:DUF547 domain-containing protein n=1 Tax=Halobacteriovorax marinus (strain ATCC BAA-682 / DSM 15412 / SJ) TaxID=862908 RepID=E1X2L7_HALMS|nr:DUF547 domain-containing protein [Halobacteriovorax marinus]CBW26784.1 hypothetical protein BMS_1969 [Halobacteriovorax marinus SJ]
MSSIKIYITLFTLAIISSCNREPDKEKVLSPQKGQADIASLKKKIVFEPKKGDISPKGYNWVHFDLASYYSGALYEHGLKGRYRESVLIKKREKLFSYLKENANVQETDFKNWNQKHQTSFLINTYHASLLKLMIKREFKNLDNTLYDEEGSILIFDNKYSIQEYIQNIFLNYVKDPNVAFTLKCFEKNCPEFRNTIYNYKNVETLVKQSAIRYFIDKDKEIIANGKVKLPYLQKLFSPILPKDQKSFKIYIEDLTKPITKNARLKLNKETSISK